MTDILKKAGYRTEAFRHGDAKFTIRELSLAERRAIAEAQEQKSPPEVIAALTLAMACADFNESDVQRLVDEVRPDVLITVATRVYELSDMVAGAKKAAKKHLGGRMSSLLSDWPWHWVKRFLN